MSLFKVTPNAAAQIRAAMPEDSKRIGLRVAARTLPDGSIDLGMGFDEQREFDFEVVAHGVSILIGPSSRPLLEGVTLDYVELSPGEFRFIFIPPEDPRDPKPPQDGGGTG